MKALIIVDVQNDFLPGGALEVPAGDEIIPILNKLQVDFDLVIATQDWHPEAHSSFASRHIGTRPFDQIEWKGNVQTLWPDHCVQGSWGAEISNKLDTNRVEAIFRKGTDIEIDSYSAFYDNNREKSTALAEYLRGRRVKEVFVGGLATDVCVYFTVMDSLKEGFNTTMILDACRGLDETTIKKSVERILKEGGHVE